ncbi:MAG: molybdopterin molybdotransferase MoeA [Thermoprotei archaeon]
MSYFREVKEKKYKHIPLTRLYELLANSVNRVDTEYVDPRYALGRVLAEPVYAKYDRPLKDISHVDGFAVNTSDTIYASQYNPAKLRLVKGVDPRNADTYTLKRGETVFIETGYPLPSGANGVVPVENATIVDDYIRLTKPALPGNHVFRRATDFRRGEEVLPAGTRITPLTVKVLLDLGYEKIRVYRKPRVAVLSIGDEISDEPYNPETGRLPASTMYLVKYSLEYYGADVFYTDILPDNPSIIVKTIRELLGRADAIITIGGVSMGPRDHTWISLYRELNPSKWWRGVKLVPGRSCSGLIVNGKPVINQPGLHQGSFNTLIMITTPLINYMQGLVLEPRYPAIDTVLATDLSVTRYIDHHRVVYLEIRDEYAVQIENPGSYYLKPLIRSDAFTVLDPGIERIRRGSHIKAYFYPPIHQPPLSSTMW